MLPGDGVVESQLTGVQRESAIGPVAMGRALGRITLISQDRMPRFGEMHH